jgi:hypothetical protein
MAHTNQTPNYALSEFIGTDKPAWLVDYNGDMEKIDLGLKAAKDVADAAKAEADQGALDIAAVTVTANSAEAKASAAISNFAEAYDSTSTYVVGEYVTYENLTYRATTDITVPESFNGNHWVRVTMDDELTAVNVDIEELNSNLGKFHMSNMTYPANTDHITITNSDHLMDGVICSLSNWYNTYGVVISNDLHQAYITVRDTNGNMPTSSLNVTVLVKLK